MLAVGDTVSLPGGRVGKVRQVHRRRLVMAAFHRLGLPLPLRIAPGALGFGRPSAALLVGPAQLLRLNGAWVPAGRLIDGDGIQQVATAIAAIRLEVDSGAAVLAAGIALAADGRLRASDASPARSGATPAGPGLAALLEGNIDHADRFGVIGWARDGSHPERVLALEVVLADRMVAQALADRPRPDLVRHGLGGRVQGAARHGFAIRFAAPLPASHPHLLVVRRAATRLAVPGSPVLIDAAGGTPEGFEAALAVLATRPAAPAFVADQLDRATMRRLLQGG